MVRITCLLIDRVAKTRTEAIEGALPIAQSTPQRPPYGLYTEKISGSAFQAARHDNQQTWLYRIIPSASHQPFDLKPSNDDERSGNFNAYGELVYVPTQSRWDPFDLDHKSDWTHSMHLLCAAGDVATKSGMGYFIYTAGQSMDLKSAFSSTDGELLIIPQTGVLDIKTELGNLLVRPLEVCVIPRGIKYNVSLPEGPARGYALELHQGVFTLPNLGPLGSFGCANTRDFQIPVAAYDDDTENSEYKIINKFNGRLYETVQDHSPFDVVSWHGTYFPYKYDLGRFMLVGSISYDHPDPSIFTLLTSSEGVAEIAIFPPRWLVMENTFRPPWFHRNTMAELMGLIQGEYDARQDGGFRPGGVSLHNTMAGHGPDSVTHARASEVDLVPQRVGEGSMAFVIETPLILGLSQWAWTSEKRQGDYSAKTWLGLKSYFQKPEEAKFNSPLLDPATGINGKPPKETGEHVNGHA